MTINDAKIAKEAMDHAIAIAITEFHAKTGCMVHSVAVDLVCQRALPVEGVYKVKTEVHL